jgi:hypothetical protein
MECPVMAPASSDLERAAGDSWKGLAPLLVLRPKSI